MDVGYNVTMSGYCTFLLAILNQWSPEIYGLSNNFTAHYCNSAWTFDLCNGLRMHKNFSADKREILCKSSISIHKKSKKLENSLYFDKKQSDVRHIKGFPAGWYPGSPAGDQRFWQVRFLWGISIYRWLVDIWFLTGVICKIHFCSPLQYIVYSLIWHKAIITIFQFHHPTQLQQYSNCFTYKWRAQLCNARSVSLRIVKMQNFVKSVGIN